MTFCLLAPPLVLVLVVRGMCCIQHPFLSHNCGGGIMCSGLQICTRLMTSGMRRWARGGEEGAHSKLYK